jgi:hypothetical protein
VLKPLAKVLSSTSYLILEHKARETLPMSEPEKALTASSSRTKNLPIQQQQGQKQQQPQTQTQAQEQEGFKEGGYGW